MTINVNEKISITEVLGHSTHHCCKPVINRTTGDIYASAKDAAKLLGVTPWAVSSCCLSDNENRTCKGNKLEYLQKTSGNVESMAKEIRMLRAQIESMKADAAVGRAIREAEEAKRKAKAEHEAAIASVRDALYKANDQIALRANMVDRAKADIAAKEKRLNESITKRNSLELLLAELEGR